ncbi:hypothetical protein OG496_31345 [Streptomyces sp. NBC_00988]|uniref:hypothetical protein n=1 Tax=Streptomyces sp. NBC_00988 TaxID=2903704 RepID=UPI00386FDE30|nr:hypothetical protein OG496_31345 [Streptomyces sp. NBC_00988]
MRAPSESVEQHKGATPPAQRPAVEVRRAFWCEHTVSEADLKIKGRPERDIVSTPGEAIRKIRMSVRRLAPALPSFEQDRALNWTDSGGSLQATGALHRGDPCGFSISSHGTWHEWTVRPFDQFLVPDELLLHVVPVRPASRPCNTAH